MFWSKNKKNRYTPAYPRFVKVWYMGVYITRTCFPDVWFSGTLLLYGTNVYQGAGRKLNYFPMYLQVCNYISCCLFVCFMINAQRPVCLRIVITKTCPCNEYPLIPHYYIAKLGYAGVYLFFLFLLQNIDCGYSLQPPRRGGSNPQSMF